MAQAIANSDAKKVLIPLNKCDVLIAGYKDKSTSELLNDTIKIIHDTIN